ncbi:hypothetical protein OQI_16335 [Streptomyces pharetrae CZA14]|uniref:Uncharacterized protein n=1 Tax=Streptomyces pharetrae CZA14 TaxID=1144883 RepID=A0ABX3YJQ0_9ACTN|nr:hypothetical protein OQI_16335 [Streptomyces pharetrae CZA14]
MRTAEPHRAFTLAGYRDGVTEQDRFAPGRNDAEHRVTTVEQGPFCVARCSCGWRGPARRARSQARTDGAGHASEG